jgi:hypothetical protein
MRRELEPLLWLFRKDRTQEAVRKLQLELPSSFLHYHRPFFNAVAELLELGRPVRVLEYGMGELPVAEARSFAQVCAALAEKTGGESLAIVFSDEAVARAGHGGDTARVGTKCLDGNVIAPSSLAGRPFDLVVHHAAGVRDQRHPLHTFWAFIELQPLVSDQSYQVFSECQAKDGERTEYVREYLEGMGLRPLASGTERVWRYTRALPPLPAVARSTGMLASLSEELRMDAASFLRIYDQMFAPLLRDRAGTFRMMLETVLSRPGPYTVIETGTTRESGDFGSNGQSTLLFDLLVNCFGGQVLTIDIDPTNLRYCRSRVSEKTTLLCSDSVKALLSLPEVAQADLIYLDSYDFDGNNPHPSSLHHMKELAALWGRTHPSCLMVIDDCFGPDRGKHAYVARFLASLGRRPDFAGYQTGWVL